MVLDQNVKREIISQVLDSCVISALFAELGNLGKNRQLSPISPRQIGGGGWGNLRSGDF